jgi:hypothetical protein
MEKFNFGRWEIESDTEATRRAYAEILKGSPEECSCEPCVNFIAARTQIYSSEIVAMFGELRIPTDREAQIYHMCQLPSGFHLYGGWFHFVGRILSGADAAKQIRENVWQPDLESSNGRFKFGFTSRVQQVRKAFEGLPLVQLEFSAEVPWLLDVKEPE